MALLSDLANAALEKTLPALDGWLRARLGASARVHSVKVDGKRVVIEQAHLPLGPRIHIDVERATLAVVAARLSSPRLYVSSAAGTLAVRGAGRTITARLELTDGRDRPDYWLAGSVRVSGEVEGNLDVELSKSSWTLRGALSSNDSSYQVRANGPLGGDRDPVTDFDLDLSDALIEQVLHHAAAWLDTEPPPFDVADGALGRGEIRWRRGRLTSETSWQNLRVNAWQLPEPTTVKTDLTFVPKAQRVHGSVDIRSVGSTIRVDPVSWRAGRFEKTSISGNVAISDACRTGMFSSLQLCPTPRGSARVELTLDGARDWLLTGTVRSERLEIEHADRAGTPVFTFERAELGVRLDRERLGIERFALEGYDTKLEGEVEIPYADEPKRPRAVVTFVDANVHFAAALASLADRSSFDVATDAMRPQGARWLARDLLLSGRVNVTHEGDIRGELGIETAGTALLVPLTVSGGKLDGTQVRGRIATADALGLGWLDGPISPRPTGLWNVRADVSGSIGAPRMQGHLESSACVLNLWGMTDLHLSDVEAHVHADEESIIVKDARAKGYGGRVRGEGVIGFTTAFHGIDWDFSCEGVAIGELVLPPGQLGQHVTGALTASLHVRRLASGSVRGEGRISLEDPSYPVIHHARDQLESVALPVPPPHGMTPLTCRVTLHDEHVEIHDLEAQVEGISLRGGGRIALDGALEGGASARLRGSYLKKSPLFVIPATISGGITVPIHIGGTLQQPKLTADVGRALKDKLHTRNIESAVTSAFDGIRDAADGAASALDDLFGGGPPKRAEKTRPVEDPELEALVDRCMEGGPSTDELIDRLIDAGVTSDDIVRILEKRRMRF